MIKESFSFFDFKRYIPNLIPTVEPEESWAETMAPFAEEAADYIKRKIVGNDLFFVMQRFELGETVKEAYNMAVVCDAWIRAIPSVDLTLMPGGNFVVAQNNSHSVASAERVNRLIDELIGKRDEARIRLIDGLYFSDKKKVIAAWNNCFGCLQQAALFSNSFDVFYRRNKEDRKGDFERFIERVEKSKEAKQELAFDFLGYKMVEVIIQECRKRTTTGVLDNVIELCRMFVAKFIENPKANKELVRIKERIVEGIIHLSRSKDADEFKRIFENSPIALRHDMPVRFKNKKESHGYFF